MMSRGLTNIFISDILSINKEENKMIGIYGGAFDPIHNGHLSVMEKALEKVDFLFVVPSYSHPFGKKMAPFEKRYTWTTRSINDKFFEIGKGMNILVSDVEAIIASQKNGPIYTIDVLRYFEEKYKLPKKEIAFIIGEDNREKLPQYKYYEFIKEYAIEVIDEQSFKHSSELKTDLTINSLKNQISDIIIPEIIQHYTRVAS